MEKAIVLRTHKDRRYVVSVKNANKKQENKYFPNSSDCCGSEIGQERFCKACHGGEGKAFVGGKTQRKIIYLPGKQKQLIPTAALDQIQEALDSKGEVVITKFIDEDKVDQTIADRYDDLVYAAPKSAKKKSEEKASLVQYAELREIMKGKVGVGVATFGSNEYQVLVSVPKLADGSYGAVRIRKLVNEALRYDFDEAAVISMLDGVEVNQALVEVCRQVAEKSKVEEYDPTQFVDTRTEMTMKVVEDYLLNGKVSDVVQNVVAKQETDDIAALKELL